MSHQPLLQETFISEGTACSSGIPGTQDRILWLTPPVGSIPGTSSSPATKVWTSPYTHEADVTVNGRSCDLAATRTEREVLDTRRVISELRRRSGLTWKQLGQLFNVSRRSVHYWASGKPLSASNEQRLMRVQEVVRTADRGCARRTRMVLLNASEGTSPFEMLADQRFDEARDALGQGLARPILSLTQA